MTKNQRTVLWVIAGIVLCVLVVGAGTAAWFFMSAFESAESDDAAAEREFASVRQRLGTAPPIIEVDGQAAIRKRQPPLESAGRELRRLHVLAWRPNESRLSRITLPWWLIRMSNGPVNLTPGAGDGIAATQTTVSPEEIERYGPAVLLEHAEPDGSRVLVWTE